MKYLIIVESPAKCKKIKNILIEKYPNDYFDVKASVGHIFNLPKNSLGVNLKTFEGKFQELNDKRKIIRELKNNISTYDKILIATDQDNEGEAIGYDIMNLLNIDLESKSRMVFNEITENGIIHAFENLTYLNMNMVNAQRARRILDRLIGFKISTITKKIFNNKEITAGRVLSVSTKIILDDNNNYNNFVNEEINEIFGDFNINNETYKLKYSALYTNNIMNSFLNKDFYITEPLINNRIKKPSLPFITSSINSASPYPIKQTSGILQKLYQRGLITYIRTDSYNISKTAKTMISTYINQNYSDKYLDLSKINHTNSITAHECIRPTKIDKYPSLSGPDKVIYDMIFKRTISYMMKPCNYNEYFYKIKMNDSEDYFSLLLSDILFDGFAILNKNIKDDKRNISYMETIDIINPHIIYNEKNFKTYNLLTEGSFIKKLKSYNIGRPSTYSYIIENMKKKNYINISNIAPIKKEINQTYIKNNKIKSKMKKIIIPGQKNKLIITETGIKVSEFLNNKFNIIIDYDYSSKLEDYLTEIQENKINKDEVIKIFYNDIKPMIDEMKILLKKEKRVSEITLGSYDIFSKILIKHTRYGWKIISYYKGVPLYLDFNNNLKLNVEKIKINDIIQYLPIIKKYNNKDVIFLIGRDGGKYIKYNKKNIPLARDIKYKDFSYFNNLNDLEIENIINKK